MENRESVDQKQTKVWRFVTENSDELSRGGAVVAGWRVYRGCRLGPYFRLTCRTEGRQRSCYLGADPKLANQVREELRRLQAPLVAERRLNGQRRSLRRELARQRQFLEDELQAFGLWLQGGEVRGWRRRPAMEPVPEFEETGDEEKGRPNA